MKRNAVGMYAGTFDPFTMGHLDILERARRCCERLVLAVYTGSYGKQGMWSAERRVAAAQLVCAGMSDVEVLPFEGLLVEVARNHGVGMVFRGIRDAKDGVYEGQMAAMNACMYEGAETLLLTASPQWAFLSATWVRDIARHGGDVRPWMPEVLHDWLDDTPWP